MLYELEIWIKFNVDFVLRFRYRLDTSVHINVDIGAQIYLETETGAGSHEDAAFFILFKNLEKYFTLASVHWNKFL